MTEEKTKTISSDPQIAALEAALAESRRQVEALVGAHVEHRTTSMNDELARTRLREANEAREGLLARINPQMTPGTYLSTETLPELLKRYDGLVDLNAAEAREARQWLAMQLDRAGLENATLLEMIKRYDQKEHDRARQRAEKLRARLQQCIDGNDGPSHRKASEARLEQLNRQGVAFGEQLAELREKNAELTRMYKEAGKSIDQLTAELQEMSNSTTDKLQAEVAAWERLVDVRVPDGAEVLEMRNELSGVVTLVGRLNVAVAYDPRHESEASARARLRETISNVCTNAADVKVGGTPTQEQILKFYGQVASDVKVGGTPTQEQIRIPDSMQDAQSLAYERFKVKTLQDDIQALYGEREEVHQLCAAATGAAHAKIYDAVLALRDKYYALKARIARPLTNLARRLEDLGARCTQLGTRVENFEHKAVINVAFTYQQLVEANREAIDQLSPAVRAIFKDGFWPMPRGFETASSNWRENEGAVQMSAPLRPEERPAPLTYGEAVLRATPYEHVDHPPHYQKHPSGIEAIDLCERLSFNYGNAVKYLWRVGKKGNALEDLKKARWYLLRHKNQRGGSSGVLEEKTSALIDSVVETDGGILGAVLRGVNKGKNDIYAKIKLIDVAIQDLSGGSLGKESK